jgi:YggT family protein
MSWFYNAVNTGMYEFLRKIIEPVLYPFRKLPLQFAGVDFSLMALMVVLIFVKKIIQQFLLFG